MSKLNYEALSQIEITQTDEVKVNDVIEVPEKSGLLVRLHKTRYRHGSDYCRFAAAYINNALMFVLKGALMNHLRRHYVAAYYRNALMSCCKKVAGRRFRQSYYGKRIMNTEEGNEFLFELISRGNPFAVARFGSTELRTLVQYIGVELGVFENINKVFGEYLCSSSGFFPNENRYLLKFGRIMQEAASQVDLLAVWENPMEDYVAEQWLKQSYLMELPGLSEPYSVWHTRPWTKALKGRRVLVVHPFVDSIRKQYEKNRDKLFANKDILPEFELFTIRAVQTVANTKCEFKDWFEALESMVEQASRIDYDIAIIGAGAYGFPLAARFKQQAKQAIHLAGATQILFGIKGRRWDNIPKIAKHYNEHWIYPIEQKPENAEAAGVGTYW